MQIVRIFLPQTHSLNTECLINPHMQWQMQMYEKWNKTYCDNVKGARRLLPRFVLRSNESVSCTSLVHADSLPMPCLSVVTARDSRDGKTWSDDWGWCVGVCERAVLGREEEWLVTSLFLKRRSLSRAITAHFNRTHDAASTRRKRTSTATHSTRVRW